LDKNLAALLEKNQMLFLGEVDRKMFDYAHEAILLLTAKGSPDIEISITSNGGSVDSGLDVYDLLRLYAGKKVITIYSIAASMGAIIIQACDQRKVARHAKVLIHYVGRRNINLYQLKDSEELEKIIKDLQESQDRLEAILIERTKQSVDIIRDECNKDRTMTAEEAHAFGLVDEIV